jgi:hypothetical protein
MASVGECEGVIMFLDWSIFVAHISVTVFEHFQPRVSINMQPAMLAHVIALQITTPLDLLISYEPGFWAYSPHLAARWLWIGESR